MLDDPNIDSICRASQSTVYPIFRARAQHRPDAPAIEVGARTLTYDELLDRVDRMANELEAAGVLHGQRVAVLSENRWEYTALQLACAKLGAIVACLNWRLNSNELQYCINLVTPVALVTSSRFMALSQSLAEDGRSIISLGLLGDQVRLPGGSSIAVAEPEDGLLILYTSGTTGFPKAALISHRAEIARMCVTRLDLGIAADDAYVAWSPMFHMGGTEHVLTTLMSGGLSIIVDGFALDAIVDAILRHRLGWLLLVPGTIEPLLQRMRDGRCRPRGIKVVGCMADLVPPSLIAAITTVLNAPYLDSFGSTETGLPPLSAKTIPAGQQPSKLTKKLSMLTEFQLINPDGTKSATGAVGEGSVRGPTLFSGYWNAESANKECFTDGWFRMGDLFRRCDDGGFEFVGRTKYLIKSGGENIYPAEIERVLLADSRVSDAVVVRKQDPRWGEVPVAFIAGKGLDLGRADMEHLCRSQLPGYKCPSEFFFIEEDDFPRSTSGKILREELERRLQ